MFYFSRGGTRGGKDQFSWEDIKRDKHKEFYLGNSLHTVRPTFNCPKPNTGWYMKTEEEKRKEDLERIKEKESLLINQALGIQPKKRLQSNRKLDNTEIAELTRRGSTDRGNLDIDRVEGLGFAPSFTHESSAPTLLEGNNFKTPSFTSIDDIKKERKEKKKNKKKEKKEKKHKKKHKKDRKRKRRSRHDSDDEDNNEFSKNTYRHDSDDEEPQRKRRRYNTPPQDEKERLYYEKTKYSKREKDYSFYKHDDKYNTTQNYKDNKRDKRSSSPKHRYYKDDKYKTYESSSSHNRSKTYKRSPSPKHRYYKDDKRDNASYHSKSRNYNSYSYDKERRNKYYD